MVTGGSGNGRKFIAALEPDTTSVQVLKEISAGFVSQRNVAADAALDPSPPATASAKSVLRFITESPFIKYPIDWVFLSDCNPRAKIIYKKYKDLWCEVCP